MIKLTQQREIAPSAASRALGPIHLATRSKTGH